MRTQPLNTSRHTTPLDGIYAGCIDRAQIAAFGASFPVIQGAAASGSGSFATLPAGMLAGLGDLARRDAVRPERRAAFAAPAMHTARPAARVMSRPVASTAVAEPIEDPAA